ncbi:MAG: hypothetical protein AABY93_00285, partial [Bacteroidota bacterium]
NTTLRIRFLPKASLWGKTGAINRSTTPLFNNTLFFQVSLFSNTTLRIRFLPKASLWGKTSAMPKASLWALLCMRSFCFKGMPARMTPFGRAKVMRNPSLAKCPQKLL